MQFLAAGQRNSDNIFPWLNRHSTIADGGAPVFGNQYHGLGKPTNRQDAVMLEKWFKECSTLIQDKGESEEQKLSYL